MSRVSACNDQFSDPVLEQTMQPTRQESSIQLELGPKSATMLSCSECRRLQLKCDKIVPCSNCIRRGCASICRDGEHGTSQNPGATEKLFPQEITQMGNRIWELEEASASLPSDLSDEPHPFLTNCLHVIGLPTERPVGEEALAPKDLNIGPQQGRPEGGDINSDVFRRLATVLHSSEGRDDKKRPTSTSNPSIYQPPQAQQLQHLPLQVAAAGSSSHPSDFIRGHSQQGFSYDAAVLQSSSSSVRLDLPISLNSNLYERFDSDKHTFKQPSTVACVPCRKLKMRCNFVTDSKTCERCSHRGCKCIMPGQKSSRALEQERLISQIRWQAEQMKKIMGWIKTASQSPEHPSNPGLLETVSQLSSFSNALQSIEPKRTTDEWISRARDSFLQFEDAIPKSHISKNDANMIPKPPPKACSRCKGLKVKCELSTDSAACKRCLQGGHDCSVQSRKARSGHNTLPKRERLINSIRTQADYINQLISKLELVQQTTKKPPDLESDMSAYNTHSQPNLPDSVPVSGEINPRIEEWLSIAKQSVLQSENFLSDLEYVEDDDSDLASLLDDCELSDIGPDADADFPSSHLRKQASHSSINTAITSVAGSAGSQAKLSVLALSNKDPEDLRSGEHSEERKERRTGIGHLVQDFEVRSTGIPGPTTHDTPSLSPSNRKGQLSAIFGQHVVELALLNSHLNSARPHCYSGTREKVLNEIRSCLCDTEGWSGLVFLRGAAGVGKTAIMQTLAERENEDKRTLGAIFYEHKFSLQTGSFGRLVFPILAYQLALQDELYADDIIETLDRHKSVLDESLQKQFDILIAGPWARRCSRKPYVQPLLVILDGLDGRGMDKESYRGIVELISHYTPERISWIISNPTEPLALSSPSQAMEIEIPIGSDDACEDMEGYLRSKFDAICQRFPTCTPEQWPPEDDLLRVATAASGYFAFATSIIDFVGDPSVADPVGQLNAAIAYITGCNFNSSPFATLDILYSDALHRASPLGLSIAMLLISLFLIPSIRFSKVPPSMVVACNILRMSKGVVHYSLSQLSALLDVPPDDSASTRPLKLLHSSFEDFLLNPARSGAQSIDLVAHKLEIQQCCTAIAQQVNGTPENVGGLENIQLTWCPTGSDAGEERKKVYIFAARILASLWEPK